MKMEKYIKFDSGNLYAYDDTGITIVLDTNGCWRPSKLDYMGILYSDRKDYKEMDETDVALEYGEEVKDAAKECFEKIKKMLYGKKR